MTWEKINGVLNICDKDYLTLIKNHWSLDIKNLSNLTKLLNTEVRTNYWPNSLKCVALNVSFELIKIK